jgi:hypothetical protein
VQFKRFSASFQPKTRPTQPWHSIRSKPMFSARAWIKKQLDGFSPTTAESPDVPTNVN